MTSEYYPYSSNGIQHYKNVSSTGTTTIGQSTVTALIGSMARNSVNTPGYVERAAEGKLPENPFYFTRRECTAWSGRTYSWRFPGNETWTWGDLWYAQPQHPSSIPISLHLANLENVVKAQLLEKLRGPGVDFGTFAGEFAETVRSFSNAVKLAAIAFDGVRRRDRRLLSKLFPKGSTPAGVAADSYLGVAFGLMPLLSDAWDSASSLERGLMKKGFFVVRDRKIVEDGTTIQVTSSVTEIWKLRCEVSGRIKYQQDDIYVATLASMGLTNPLSVAWELVSKSFVIDWLIGVGSWISQIDASFGKSFAGGSITNFYELSCLGIHRVSSSSPSLIIDEAAQMSYRYIACSRLPLETFPVLWMPPINTDGLSFGQVISGIALLKTLR